MVSTKSMVDVMEKEIIYILGHKNPDTDSICSAIGLAELKRAEGVDNIEPARAGDINPQTSFILNYFNIKPPKYLANVYPRAKDIMSKNVISVTENTTLLRTMEIIREENVRFIPVLDKSHKPKGIVTLMDLAKIQIAQIEAESSRMVFTSASNIKGTLKGEMVTDFMGDSEINLYVYVGAMMKDSFLKVLGDSNPRECAVIVGDREQIQRISVERGICILIITGGLKVNSLIIDAARKRGVTIIISPFDSATTALRVRLSTPAHKVCNSEFEKVSPDDLVEDIKHRLTKSKNRGLVVLDTDGVMQGIITKSNLLRPSGIKLILVDHNELSQAIDGAEEVKIIEVVDHHRLGNFHTTQPISFLCEPVGSTSTIVSELFREKGIKIKRETAGLLLGGVLSDTVMLRSPTTTERDREIVPWLEEKSGLNHLAFGREIFTATSSLKKMGVEAVVKGDYKTYDAKGKKFGIGQVETVGFDEFYEVKEDLKGELLKVKNERGLRLSTLLITDIVYGNSLLLVVGEKEVIYNLDYPKLEEDIYELKNVLSRKKQLAPHFLSLFNEIY
ncbi:MAG: putative manganese-dependent inorganic diphosphatase [Thermodesulfobacteriota bacterium]